MELNLRPASVVQARETAARIPCIVVAGLCLLAILASWLGYFHQATQVQTAVSEKLKVKIDVLQGMQNKFEAIKKTIKAKQDVGAPLVAAVEEREYWVGLLDDLNSRLPARAMWITSLEVETPKLGAAAPVVPGNPPSAPPLPVLVVKGYWLENSRGVNIVDDYAAALAKSTFYTVDPIKDRPDQSKDDWATGFTLRLVLKKPLAP